LLSPGPVGIFVDPHIPSRRFRKGGKNTCGTPLKGCGVKEKK
jgi:hypothetical protein